MAVEPAAFVPPTLQNARIHPHGDDVWLAAEAGEGGQVDISAIVAAPVVADDIAVEPYGRGGRHPLELKLDIFAAVGFRQSEALAIPCNPLRAVPLGDVLALFERA